MTIVHRNVAVLKVSEPQVFNEIRAVVALDDHVMGWISETEAVVDPASLKVLLDGLEARGLGALVRRTGQPD